MALVSLEYIVQIVIPLLILKPTLAFDEMGMCKKNPFKTVTDALPPDDRFALEIVDVEDTYIPEKEYIVKLKANDDLSKFIAFSIFAMGDQTPNEKNARRPNQLDPGTISSSKEGDQDTIAGECKNSVVQRTLMPKTEVEILWKAPPKGNRCVKIFADVSVKRDVWYSSDGPLSKVVCEDLRKIEDMKPVENNNCQVCEDARYEVIFEGLWSYNTHPDMFPVTKNVAKFSDIVGASHNKNFVLYKDDVVAIDGLAMLVDQGNTSLLEKHILDNNNIGTSVRTLVKATAPPNTALSTLASFRTSQDHHFLSLVTAILPSPDWFLGAYDIELCKAGRNANTSEWTKSVLLNLYPMDAGVDSGTTFESPNEKTTPPAAIGKAKILPDKPLDKYRPFARLHINLITTYPKQDCQRNLEEDNNEPTDDRGTDTSSEDNIPEPYEPPSVTSSPPPPPPTHSGGKKVKCLTTEWEDWQPCEGDCVDNKIVGYKSRFRSYLVNGVAVENDDDVIRNKVPAVCIDTVPTFEMTSCEEPCEPPTEEPEASRQLAEERLRPGQRWKGRK